MENKNYDLQSRRQFFKKASKIILPIWGAMILPLPVIAKTPERVHMGCKVSYYDAGPSSHCSTCYGQCKETCVGGCYNSCKGNCRGDCMNSCNDSCHGSCNNTCAGSCKNSCSGSSK